MYSQPQGHCITLKKRMVNVLLLLGGILLSDLLHLGSEAVCRDCFVAAELVALGYMACRFMHGCIEALEQHAAHALCCQHAYVKSSCLC